MINRRNGQNSAKKISFENDCYIVDLPNSVVYSDYPALSETDKRDIIDLSINFKVR